VLLKFKNKSAKIFKRAKEQQTKNIKKGLKIAKALI
jgi:hypothetical protein